MTNKLTIITEVTNNLQFNVDIDEFIKNLYELKARLIANGAEKIMINDSAQYYTNEIEVVGYRYETDDEFNDRMLKIKELNNKNTIKRYNQYLKLKEEFENDDGKT